MSVNLATSKATGIGTTFAGIQTVTGQLSPSMPDTLTRRNRCQCLGYNGRNSGTVNGLNFANFGNLTGGTAVDTFTVGTSGSLTGTLNGGGGSNILVGPNLPSTFNITAKNAGNLTSSTGVLNFTSIPNLTGGAQANVFAFSSGATIAGNLSGGTGGGTLNYTGYSTAVTVNLETNKVTGVTGLATNLAGAIGGSGTSTLTGANTANTWNITGANSGTVNTFPFSEFGNLTGGTVSDTFTMESGGSLTGTLTGTAGSTSTLVGSSLASTFTITATSAGTLTSSSGILSFKGIKILVGGSGGDTLVGANTTNTWNISGPNSGTLNAFDLCRHRQPDGRHGGRHVHGRNKRLIAGHAFGRRRDRHADRSQCCQHLLPLRKQRRQSQRSRAGRPDVHANHQGDRRNGHDRSSARAEPTPGTSPATTRAISMACSHSRLSPI